MRLLLHGATLGGAPDLTDLIEAATGGFAGVEAPWADIQTACRRGAAGFARRMARMELCVATISDGAPAGMHRAARDGRSDTSSKSADRMQTAEDDAGRAAAAEAEMEAEARLLRGLAAFGVGVPLWLVRIAARAAKDVEVRERLARAGQIAAACGLRLTLDVVAGDGSAAPPGVSESLAAVVGGSTIGLVADSLAGPLSGPFAAYARLRQDPEGGDGAAVAWAASLYQGGYRGYVAVVSPPRVRGEDRLAAAARGLRFAREVLRRAGI